MRIISGSKKGLKLQTPKGGKTRPTTDRIKETLFNMILMDVKGCRFLDLFAGSGQIGIEALSRGAEYAAFVERDHSAAECIRANIAKAGFSGSCDIYQSDILKGLAAAEDEQGFDIIFIDPPYRGSFEKDVLTAIAHSDCLLAEGGYVILEADINNSLDFLNEFGLTVFREKRYKTNKHLFIERIQYDQGNISGQL